jgi:Porphobilinogen deaminase
LLPAVGQGAIALQCRINDKKTLDILQMINHKESYCCIQAERALLEAIGGDCDTAVGGLAKLIENKIILKSELFSDDGTKKFVAESQGTLTEPQKLGYKVGQELLKKAGSNFKKKGN